MNKLDKLYAEKENQETLRQVNINYLKKQINEANDSEFELNWFLENLRQSINNIQANNEVLDDIYTQLDKELKIEENC